MHESTLRRGGLIARIPNPSSPVNGPCSTNAAHPSTNAPSATQSHNLMRMWANALDRLLIEEHPKHESHQHNIVEKIFKQELTRRLRTRKTMQVVFLNPLVRLNTIYTHS
jgi:hypothetical protein